MSGFRAARSRTGAFSELIEAGKVRYIAASNFSTGRPTEALAAADRDGLPRYVALQLTTI